MFLFSIPKIRRILVSGFRTPATTYNRKGYLYLTFLRKEKGGSYGIGVKLARLGEGEPIFFCH